MDRRQAMALIGMGAAAAGVQGMPAAARAAAPAASTPPGAAWFATVAGRPWQARSLPAPGAVPADPFATGAQVRLDAPRQTIAGFGGAFSEKGWQALAALPQAQRARALAALFGDDGCAFNHCRTPIGANDISRRWYSYDETPGDYDMAHFSIANDRETLIPFIQVAQALRPDLKVWASPWSPPTWMKKGGHYAQAPAWPGQPSNGITPGQLGQEGYDSFLLDDRTLAAYARYFRCYVEEYAKAGIRIDTVMPQNEFNSAQPFPSCCWTPEGLARFIPFLAQEMGKVGVRVFFGTLERGNIDLFDRVMAHPDAAAAIKGIGVQWAGKDALPALRERYPALELWGSEQECGVGTNDWRYARYGWQTIKRYFEHGATAWTYWNMVMPEGGMSGWGWPQNSLLVVDTQAGTFRMGEDYWLVRHLSAHVRPGARMVPVDSFLGYVDQLAFRNLDGTVVLVASNPVSQPSTVTYRVGDKALALPMEADSLNTVILPPALLA